MCVTVEEEDHLFILHSKMYFHYIDTLKCVITITLRYIPLILVCARFCSMNCGQSICDLERSRRRAYIHRMLPVPGICVSALFFALF